MRAVGIDPSCSGLPSFNQRAVVSARYISSVPLSLRLCCYYTPTLHSLHPLGKLIPVNEQLSRHALFSAAVTETLIYTYSLVISQF